MQVHAPKGQYRVVGLDHIDTLESPSGPLSKDLVSFDAAKDLADRMTKEYLWTYVYDDAGELLYEASSYWEQAQQVEMLSQEPHLLLKRKFKPLLRRSAFNCRA